LEEERSKGKIPRTVEKGPLKKKKKPKRVTKGILAQISRGGETKLAASYQSMEKGRTYTRKEDEG